VISLTFEAAAQGLAYFVGGGIFLNQLDELHVDAQYFLRGLHRPSVRAVSREDLRRQSKRIAILIPAWKESEVIEAMLLHNLETLDYNKSRYHIFCGTYPNDVATQERVDAVARKAPNVHKVVLPHDGPTSKADCLNHVYQEILAEEQRTGHGFDILLLHDAEDVIHPASLRLYAHLIPKYEFVQTPVFSLPVPATDLVSGTYVDEFAEHHLRDMLVREAIGGLVPSAGVGTAFARSALETVVGNGGGRGPFNVESLVEDYEVGLKFRLAGRRVHFACRTLRTPDGKDEYVATREYFPSGLNASIRQRSRWLLGITLQTWAQIGWQGTLPVLYCLWRDRKALVNNALLLCAYFLVLRALVLATISVLQHRPVHPWELVAGHSVLAALCAVNLAAAAWRACMKAYFVGRLNGAAHAAFSTGRVFLTNAISIAATARAVKQYLHHRITGKPLRWLKTTHAFPTVFAAAAASAVTEGSASDITVAEGSASDVTVTEAETRSGVLAVEPEDSTPAALAHQRT
jgi:adsorption protein B